MNAEPLMLRAADGLTIRATRYRSAEPRAQIVVAGATGVPQRFYRAFAEYAAGQGFTTTTLDYRGIGQSRPTTLRGFEMAYLDWARLDLAAAIDAADPSLPLYLVGHSFGGHAFGLLPNAARVDRFYTFATGAGWHGWMPWAERARVLLMWHLVGPMLVRWHGFLAWSKLGMGEDLPLGVYRDWKHWCGYPHYFFDDPHMLDEVRSAFDRITIPIVAANAVDDRWAPPASRDAFMRGYRNAAVTALDLHPEASGLRTIGHMGYFRREAQTLWAPMLRWFDSATPA
jgi:predicted alpha/beta hydrolase